MTNSDILRCLQSVFPRVEWKPDELTSFLKTIGLANPAGVVYNEREKKMYEVIYFSGHIVRCLENMTRRRDVTLLDCGCGRSYLPFFVNYVAKTMRRSMRYVGVDSNAVLVERSTKIRDELCWTNMEFHKSSIVGFVPEVDVNIVCALHACDTATDEAIARGVQLGARYIVVAPCCQRQILGQLGQTAKNVRPMRPLLEKKISKECVGVALTETLRRLAMESFGYRVDVFEFVSSRYTPKNIMLRAEKMRNRNRESLDAYRSLRDHFNVKPIIQEYLARLQ